MARVLVTGGAGFIGRRLTGRLLDHGFTVRRLLHRVQADEWSDRTEGAIGDLHDPTSLRRAVDGVDAVLHLAGRTLSFRKADFFRDNEEGTRNLAQACAEAKNPPTLIHVSSLAAAGPSTLTEPMDERILPRPISHYGQSKLASEIAVRNVCDRVPATILRPPGVFGPGDRYTFRLIFLAGKGVFVYAGRRTVHLSMIFVDDLCEMLVRSIEHGERLCDPSVDGPKRDQGLYFAAFEPPIEMGDFARLAGSMQGIERVRIFHVPMLVARIGTAFQELNARFQGRQTLINFDKLREAKGRFWTCVSEKARRHGLYETPRSFHERLVETIDWYCANGWLPPKRQTATVER
jgi:nucleoside-diphosphate-sugar epimerase